MKIGYIASHIYRHTFEINEAVELLRQRPDTRLYSFYRLDRPDVQHERMREVSAPITTWNPGAIAGGLAYLVVRRPFHVIAAAILLFLRSLRNPLYVGKNAVVFLIAMPILRDSHRNGVTHLHANFGSSPATVAWLGKHVLGVTYSVTFHAFDIYAYHTGFNDPLKKTKLRAASVVVAVHDDGRDYLRRLVPDVDTDRFCTIRISVMFSAAPRAANPKDPTLLLAAGNLVDQKGFDVLIRAAAELKRRGHPVLVRILGEGPERARLVALARAQEVEDCVEMPGYFQQAELAAHFREATAFVVPSKVAAHGFCDGIPTVMVEAWLAGTPVIASPVAGMGEILAHEQNALVFPPDDHAALTRCVLQLLETPELAKRIAAGGHTTAVAEFSPEKNVAALIAAVEA